MVELRKYLLEDKEASMKFLFQIKTKITINLLASYHQDNFKQIHSNLDNLDKGSEPTFLINLMVFQINRILKMKINLPQTDFSLLDCNRLGVIIKMSLISKHKLMVQSLSIHLDV